MPKIKKKTLHTAHLLMLFDKMYRYEMDPTRTVGATEQIRDSGRARTNRWTDGVTPPLLQRCAGGGIINCYCPKTRGYFTARENYPTEMYSKYEVRQTCIYFHASECVFVISVLSMSWWARLITSRHGDDFTIVYYFSFWKSPRLSPILNMCSLIRWSPT